MSTKDIVVSISHRTWRMSDEHVEDVRRLRKYYCVSTRTSFTSIRHFGFVRRLVKYHRILCVMWVAEQDDGYDD